jgi:hypothetical protein
VCPGGPRTGPSAPDQGAAGADASVQALVDELQALRTRLAIVEGKKP